VSQKPSKAQKETQTDSTQEKEVDVLYQRLGDRWFAFSVVDDEVYMGAIPEETLSPDQIGRDLIK
jgi:hypothetical protein